MDDNVLRTQQVTAVMHAFGGTVERYIGDSVMAVFGAPVASTSRRPSR